MTLPDLSSLRMKAWRRSPAIRRILLHLALCICTSLLLLDYVGVSKQIYKLDDVASHDLRAPATFSYVDSAALETVRNDAEAAVPPVFDFDTMLGDRLQNRIAAGFEAARKRLLELRIPQANVPRIRMPPGGASSDALFAVQTEFLRAMEFSIDADYLDALAAEGYSPATEALAQEFVGVALRRYILADRTNLASASGKVTVRRTVGDSTTELPIDDLTQIVSPEAVRQDIALYALERSRGQVSPEQARIASAIARAAIRPNLTYDQRETELRRQKAALAVRGELREVKKGTTLFRTGDVLTQRHLDMLEVLRKDSAGVSFFGRFLPLFVLTALAYTVIYQFASTNVRRVSRDVRNLEAAGFVMVVILVLLRLAISGGNTLFSSASGVIRPSGFAYVVPIAAGAMLMRILANGETALLFAAATSLFAGIMMDDSATFALYALISGMGAVAGIGLARERLQILRAGVQAALVNGTIVLLLNLIEARMGETLEVERFLWEIFFAACGGLLSSFLVLGLVPFFELFGFVTAYKLVELANLNHPLLRSLMLKAPGTYHHSVVVGSLSEAAAEAVGANALLARVASYFHDIGKIERPDCFVENLRNQPNPHDNLDPKKSAEILIRHVKEGAREARRYNLPQPITDILWMHHGTGLITFFYDKACRAAGDATEVDANAFRYPGPRPNSREAGIVHLADKVEAACRSLDPPTRERIRETIQKILNLVVADGQLELCPLTLKELYSIASSFEDVLMGIYHHRIAYPDSASIPPADNLSRAAAAGIITLEIPNPLREGTNGNHAEPPDRPGTVAPSEGPDI
jgi:cyclic-di-AMP phosphodiesterase PgpH